MTAIVIPLNNEVTHDLLMRNLLLEHQCHNRLGEQAPVHCVQIFYLLVCALKIFVVSFDCILNCRQPDVRGQR